MLSFNFNLTDLAVLLSIVLRLSLVLFMLPIFSTAGVPAALKALIVISFSIMLYPAVKQYVQPVTFEPAQLILVVVGELVYGMVFALSMLLILSAFHLAGELIGFQMGFGFAQSADPLTGARFTILSVWTQLLATILFLSINGHHLVLKILVESFKKIPIGSFTVDSGLFARVLLLSGLLFVLAVKIAAPVLAVLILTHLGLGLMSKFAPQINILATSFPVTITIGLFFLGFTMFTWGRIGTESFAQLFHFLENLSRN